MKNIDFKKFLPYIVAIVVFIAIACIYCFPVYQGKTLNSGDTIQWQGASHELIEYAQTTGQVANWTGSMFSGMPSYQISSGHPRNGLTKIVDTAWLGVERLITLFFSKEAVSYVLLYLIGFFIMMISFGVNPWLSIVASIALTFSSYFFVIIPAGHVTKVQTIGLMAPVVGGFFLIFRRRKRLLGAMLVMLFSGMGMLKHPQMSYYLLLMMVVFGIAEIYIHIKEKSLKELFISLAFFVVAIGCGVGVNFSNLASNAEYVKESTRGGASDLNQDETASDSGSQNGLDLDYVTAWSYGIGETMTFLIPDFKGGSSVYDIGTDSEAYKSMVSRGVDRRQAASLVQGYPTYWGEKPSTSGPVYVGAIICFLFVLAVCIVKGPYKWALIISTILSCFLAWGKNMMWFTELFYNYFPFYNKFRAVESILVVAEFAIPILAFLGVNQILKGDFDKKKVLKGTYIAAGVTGGLCLLFALFGPSLLSFTSSYDQVNLGNLPDWFFSDLIRERQTLLTTDCVRSLIFIVLAFVLVLLSVNRRVKNGVFIGALGILIVADMWPVDRRFFNESNFVTPKSYNTYFEKQPYEEAILQDKSYFRVANISSDSPFNDARTSYYLKSIGGYHAAKLRRYSDLINEHLGKYNMNAFNMLNAKYFIVDNGQGVPTPQYNPGALGNAWFVDKITIVPDANAESAALNTIDPAVEAVTDVQFADFVNSPITEHDYSASIELLDYAPDILNYKSHSSIDKTAVFSEIYYGQGWKGYIDGVPADHFRVDYVLRAMNIPAGDHTIRFEFRPDSIYKGYFVDEFFRLLTMILMIGFAIKGVLCLTRKRVEA